MVHVRVRVCMLDQGIWIAIPDPHPHSLLCVGVHINRESTSPTVLRHACTPFGQHSFTGDEKTEQGEKSRVQSPAQLSSAIARMRDRKKKKVHEVVEASEEENRQGWSIGLTQDLVNRWLVHCMCCSVACRYRGEGRVG